MRSSFQSAKWRASALVLLGIVVGFGSIGFASAYNGRPKLIVVIVIDQFRGDYLERYRDQFGDGGFRLFLDHGAYFPDCNYNYANTRTAPGHSTLFTGAYTNGHGLVANEFWDFKNKHDVPFVEDRNTKLVGVTDEKPGASPRNLLADTVGDELKLATDGRSRVFGISLKDRAAVLPAGHAGDGAYWIEPKNGAWVTSSYYRSDLPKWVQDYNAAGHAAKYWDREWRDAKGNVLRSTAPRRAKDGSEAGFFEVVGSTPFGNEYEFEFAKELVVYEKLGTGPVTDLLSISLSPNDILGHEVGPGAPEMEAMALALDRELADFFNFLGHQIGLANIWIALSADHGISTRPETAQKLRITTGDLDASKLDAEINNALTAKFSAGRPATYMKLDFPFAWLNQGAFEAAHVNERDAETAVGEAMKHTGLRDYHTKWQLAEGALPNTAVGRKYLNSYSPEGGWWVMGVPEPYTIGGGRGANHTSPYTYDTHVPLAFYGLPFQPGTYRTPSEPIDLAPTLASLLGINAPTHSVGRVLTEALAQPHHEDDHAGASKP